MLFKPGDAIRAASPGGGGYGDPLTRDLAAVERDLNRGYVSRERAEQDYGVVVAQASQLTQDHTLYKLDAAASAERRKALQQQAVSA